MDYRQDMWKEKKNQIFPSYWLQMQAENNIYETCASVDVQTFPINFKLVATLKFNCTVQATHSRKLNRLDA